MWGGGMSEARLFELSPYPVEPEREPFVMAATAWASNAAMIVDLVRLGYLRAEWNTLDATYGEGHWWDLWWPERLTTNDWDVDKPAEFHDDFRQLRWDDGTFDAVAYDPPYIAPGGREKSTIGNFNDRFGLHSTPAKSLGLQEMINAGLKEVARCVRRRGLVLVKCTNYVNGGKLWPGVFLTWQAGEACGLELWDCLEHLSGTGPQSQTTQEHARSNYSTLLVFRAR